MENILELQQICKTFPKLDFILDKISFSLPYGAILGFVGENGAGKTTCNKPDRMTWRGRGEKTWYKVRNTEKWRIFDKESNKRCHFKWVKKNGVESRVKTPGF